MPPRTGMSETILVSRLSGLCQSRRRRSTRNPRMSLKLLAGAAVTLSVLLGLPAFAAPAKIDAYLLTSDETARMRRFDGIAYGEMRDSTAIRASLHRVFADIAGKAMGPSPGPKPRWPLADGFLEGLRDSGRVEVVERRFLVADGCDDRYCAFASMFVADLQTGHVAIAYVVSRGEETARAVTARKACADPDLIRFAADRFPGFFLGYRQAGDPSVTVPVEAVVTPCRAVTPGSVKKNADRRPLFVHPLELPPLPAVPQAEMSELRTFVGRPWSEVRAKSKVPQTLRWMIHDIAGRGFYLAVSAVFDNVTDRFFVESGVTHSALLAEGRLLFVTSCSEGCIGASMLIVDRETGRIAAGIVHETDAAGVAFYEFGHATLFLGRCADVDFSALAQTHFRRWAAAFLARRHGDEYPGFDALTVVPSSCG